MVIQTVRVIARIRKAQGSVNILRLLCRLSLMDSHRYTQVVHEVNTMVAVATIVCAICAPPSVRLCLA